MVTVPVKAVVAAIIEHEYASEFLGDLAARIRDRKELTPNQLTAAGRAVKGIAERAERQAAQDAQQAEFAASGKTVPAGRVTFTGEILTVRYEESGFSYNGGAFKCLILADDGYKAWGTMPGALISQAREEVLAERPRRDWDLKLMNGRRVELTATVTPKQGEAGFGFFSRPKGQLLAAVEA